MSKARQTTRAVAVVLCMLAWLPLVWLGYITRQRWLSGGCVRNFFWCLCRIIGLQVVQFGAPDARRPLLIASNHTSYLDIFALGSVVPMAFTPKSEIAKWPLIGFLCRMAGCVFIDRRPRAVVEHRAMLEGRLAAGERVALFPEGTTGLGHAVLPFRGGFFSMVAWRFEQSGRVLPIQPVALAYTHLGDAALTPATRDQVAWVGDAEFAPHWLALMAQRSVRVEIHWLPAFEPNPAADRRELAQQCEALVAAKLCAVLPDAAPEGRLPRAEAAATPAEGTPA